MLYLEQGQYQKALPLLELAARKQPENHNIHYALGRAQEATDQIRAAHTSYTRAVNYRRTKYNLEFKEAQEALQRITELLATLPSTDITEPSNNNTGVIESYNESRGFGFINSNSQRIFFHVSAFVGKQKICHGLRVKFSSETSPKGLRAVRVEIVEDALRLAS